MSTPIADIRRNYSKKALLESEADADPIVQFGKWWEEALKAEIVEPNAMTVATSSTDGLPSARIVLLKGFSEKGFVFYTNYSSYKGQQLAENPKACLVFFWKELERQVRITGLVTKTDAKDSDHYFHSRPKESQVGAASSPQSEVIPNREWLDSRFKSLQAESEKGEIPRPKHWGGYIVRPVVIEFWQGGASRLHDRLQYTLLETGLWKIERLAP